MEDWSKDFFQMLDSFAVMVDEFFLEVAEVVDDVVEEVENTISTELEQFFDEILEPLIDVYADLEVSETDEYFYYNFREEPTLGKNPACIGCRHYHGQVYGGNMLVCGMHPYGQEDDTCPDWESLEVGASTSKTFY